MKKDIKDYLHLYWKQRVRAMYNYHVGDYSFVKGNEWQLSLECMNDFMSVKDIPFKLLLRPLSDMNDDESEETGLNPLYEKHIEDGFNPDTFLYLLKQGFDLFGLIESGLAIDKTTMK